MPNIQKFMLGYSLGALPFALGSAEQHPDQVTIQE